MNPDVIHIHHPIVITPAEIDAWLKEKKRRSSDDNPTGIWYLELAWLKEKFQPIFDKLGVNLEITKGWVHYMKKGGFRTSHEHSGLTGLYYARIPKGSARMVLEDDNTTVEPVEGDFYLLPKDLKHRITTHESGEIRWAIAFDCRKILK